MRAIRSWQVVTLTLATALLASCGIDWSIDPTNPDYDKKPPGPEVIGGAGGSGGVCAGDADCIQSYPPAPPCQEHACFEGVCGMVALPAGSPCGTGLACDGDGHCACTVESAAMCPGLEGECRKPVCEAGDCGVDLSTGETCGSGAGVCSQGKCLHVEGIVCAEDAECLPGHCVDGVCCGVTCEGACEGCSEALTGMPDGVCAPLLAGGMDRETGQCTDEAGCGATLGFCACEDGVLNNGETDVDCGGPCGATCTIGQLCTGNPDCAAGATCVDGRCCSGVCAGSCRQCDRVGLAGLCVIFMGVDFEGGCNGSVQCSASGECGFGSGGPCLVGGECASGVCSGGVCIPCNGANPCPAGDACSAAHCIPQLLDAGAECIDAGQCVSGVCKDGVCCNAACNGSCMACNQGYTGVANGVCWPIEAGLDPQDECSGPGKAATCSGAPDPDVPAESSCGVN